MNNKIKVAVVTLGDSRKDFFLSRINIVNDELQKLKETLGEKYDLYMPDIVYDIEEGQMASDEIIKRGIKSVIIHIPIWGSPNLALRIAYSTELPVLLLGNKRPDSSSIVCLLAVAGMLEQSGKKCIRVAGDIRDEAVYKKVENFIAACNLVDVISRSSFGLIGGRSIGIGTTVADPSQWQKIFGTEFDHCDQYEVVYRAKQISQERVQKHLNWLKSNIPNIEFGGLFTEDSLERQVRSYLALKDIVHDRKYTFLGLKCQQELSDYFALQCISVALLNNNYDADGPKEVIPTACESDCDGAMTMKLLSICSGNQPTNLVDIKFFDKDKKEFILANCGSIAFYFADPEDPCKAMDKLSLLPHVFVKADIDYDKFFHTMNSNHLHTVYGSYSEVLKLFCDMKGIEFICYNNK